MTEISVQPNNRDGALLFPPPSLKISVMPKRGPHRPREKPAPKQAHRNFVKAWRLYRGMTVEELAEKSRMSAGNVSAIENQQQGWSAESLLALANALRTTTGALLLVDPTGDESMWALWDTATASQKAMIERLARQVVTPED